MKLFWVARKIIKYNMTQILVKHFEPEFTIVSIHYKARIAAAILDL